MTATVGVRPCRPDGSVDTDSLMIAAAVMSQGQGRTRYRWVRRKRDLVVLEFLEREPSEGAARWVARCVHGCLPAESFPAGGPPLREWSCCNAPGYVTLVPAGWAWAGDSSWSLDRARELGALERDPENVWGRFPIACLFGKAIREGMKAFAPDALPLGVRIYYDDEPKADAGSRPAESTGPRWACPVCSLVVPERLRESYAFARLAWACPGTCGAYLVASENGVALAQGEDVARAAAWAAGEQAARLRAAPTKDARVDHGPCLVCGKTVAAGAPYQAAGNGKSAHPECVAVRAATVNANAATLTLNQPTEGAAPTNAAGETHGADAVQADPGGADRGLDAEGQGGGRPGAGPGPQPVADRDGARGRADAGEGGGQPGPDRGLLTNPGPSAGAEAIPPALPPAEVPASPSAGAVVYSTVPSDPKTRGIDECPVEDCGAWVPGIDAAEVHEGSGYTCKAGHELTAWVVDGVARLAVDQVDQVDPTPRERYVEAFVALSDATHAALKAKRSDGNPEVYADLALKRDKARANLETFRAFKCPDCRDPLSAEDLDEPDVVFTASCCGTAVVVTDGYAHVAALLEGARLEHVPTGHQGKVLGIDGSVVRLATAAAVDGVATVDAWDLRVPDELDEAMAQDAAETSARILDGPPDPSVPLDVDAGQTVAPGTLASKGLARLSTEAMRRERAAKWKRRPKRTAKKARPCAECQQGTNPLAPAIKVGDEFHEGLKPIPDRKKRLDQPEGDCCLLCVDELDQGRDPRAKAGAA